MPTFKVTYSTHETYELEVEAKSAEEAFNWVNAGNFDDQLAYHKGTDFIKADAIEVVNKQPEINLCIHYDEFRKICGLFGKERRCTGISDLGCYISEQIL